MLWMTLKTSLTLKLQHFSKWYLYQEVLYTKEDWEEFDDLRRHEAYKVSKASNIITLLESIKNVCGWKNKKKKEMFVVYMTDYLQEPSPQSHLSGKIFRF